MINLAENKFKNKFKDKHFKEFLVRFILFLLTIIIFSYFSYKSTHIDGLELPKGRFDLGFSFLAFFWGLAVIFSFIWLIGSFKFRSGFFILQVVHISTLFAFSTLSIAFLLAPTVFSKEEIEEKITLVDVQTCVLETVETAEGLEVDAYKVPIPYRPCLSSIPVPYEEGYDVSLIKAHINDTKCFSGITCAEVNMDFRCLSEYESVVTGFMTLSEPNTVYFMIHMEKELSDYDIKCLLLEYLQGLSCTVSFISAISWDMLVTLILCIILTVCIILNFFASVLED